MIVKVKKLVENAVIPSYAKPGDAGMDLVATSIIFDKYGNVSYGTGISMEIPEGYVGLIFPRSSICKQDLSLSNAVGVIDSGYRGEIFAKFKPTAAFMGFSFESVDSGDYDVVALPGENRKDTIDPDIYKVGDRIAQIIIIPYPYIEFKEVEELSDTERGDGGFGHTGL